MTYDSRWLRSPATRISPVDQAFVPDVPVKRRHQISYSETVTLVDRQLQGRVRSAQTLTEEFQAGRDEPEQKELEVIRDKASKFRAYAVDGLAK
jgi:hypothetical protein